MCLDVCRTSSGDNPVHAAIICSLESVFGIMLAVIFLGDILTPRIVAGCILVFLAVVLTEVWEPLMLRFRYRKTAGEGY